MPKASSLSIKMLWLIVLKAFLKSTYLTPTLFPWSTAFLYVLVNSSSNDPVDIPF